MTAHRARQRRAEKAEDAKWDAVFSQFDVPWSEETMRAAQVNNSGSVRNG